MLPRLAWAGSGRGDRPGRSPPRPGAAACEVLPLGETPGSACDPGGAGSGVGKAAATSASCRKPARVAGKHGAEPNLQVQH